MVFESGRKLRAKTPRPRSKYAQFLERVKKENDPPRVIEKEIKKAYQNGDLEKNEFFTLIKKLKVKTDKQTDEELDKSPKSKKKEPNYNKMEDENEKKRKETDKTNPFAGEESNEGLEEYRGRESFVSGHEHKHGILTNLLSNSNMRLGFFVVIMFALLFFVTKDVLSSKGNGEMLIFAIVLLGILFILGSSGSKHESRNHF